MLIGPFKELLDDGIAIKDSISRFLADWPCNETGTPLYWSETSGQHQQSASDLTITLRQWFNAINQIIMPLVLHDRTFLYYTLRQAEAAVRKGQYRAPMPDQQSSSGTNTQLSPESGVNSRRLDIVVETRLEIAQRDYAEAMETAFDLIRSVPSPRHQFVPSAAFSRNPSISPPAFQPDMAFILMWLDKSRPELEDVVNVIKSVCLGFGIRAFRADEVEHQDVITDIVLEYIRTAEFLIADLSGERPNVYYEVGFAHAIGKRPILFRREGSNLHFDLSVHNVPVYKNVTELGNLLRRRLEAITGKTQSGERTVPRG